MNFGEALQEVKRGKRVARLGWNGSRMWIALFAPTVPEERGAVPLAMTVPYLYMFTADKQLVPWLASQTDLLAEDWVVAPY